MSAFQLYRTSWFSQNIVEFFVNNVQNWLCSNDTMSLFVDVRAGGEVSVDEHSGAEARRSVVSGA